MQIVERTCFLCDICKQDIIIGSNGVKVITQQTKSSDFLGTLVTYHVESECNDNEIHVNIVVLDSEGKYRGHKYSTVKAEQPDERLIGNLHLILGFGRHLSKVITSTLEGHSIVLCGNGAITNLWASTLQNLFSLSPYSIRPWIISKEEFQNEFHTTSLKNAGEFVLIDESLLRLARKTMPTTLLVDLKKKKVHGGKTNSLVKDLVTTMLSMPSDQNVALLNMVKIQVDWLKRLLGELREELGSSIVETLVCPLGNVSETVLIKSVINQLITREVLENLKARMREEEYDIVVTHLLREVPILENIVDT